jgi:hypothetical protein
MLLTNGADMRKINILLEQISSKCSANITISIYTFWAVCFAYLRQFS